MSLALYEATRDIGSEIVTLDIEKEFIAIAKDAFQKYQATDRIEIIEGDCTQRWAFSSFSFKPYGQFLMELHFGSLSQLQGDFDLIYIDADQFQYETYVRVILDRKLLSPKGIILVDDGN